MDKTSSIMWRNHPVKDLSNVVVPNLTSENHKNIMESLTFSWSMSNLSTWTRRCSRRHLLHMFDLRENIHHQLGLLTQENIESGEEAPTCN